MIKLASFIRKLPIVVAFFPSVFYCITVIAQLNKDTTVIFNVAFGIAAALSSLCFGMSASINESDEDKKRIAYCGERFLHASILFLIGSVLKYSALEVNQLALIESFAWIQEISKSVFHILAVPLFLWSVYDMHTGITISNNILWERLYRDKDWDSIV